MDEITLRIYEKISRFWKQLPSGKLEYEKKYTSFDLKKNHEKAQRLLSWYFEFYEGEKINIAWFEQWVPFADEETQEMYEDWQNLDEEEDQDDYLEVLNDLKSELIKYCQPILEKVKQMCIDGTLYEPEQVDTLTLTQQDVQEDDLTDDYNEWLKEFPDHADGIDTSVEKVRYRRIECTNENDYEIFVVFLEETFYQLTQKTNSWYGEYASDLADASSGGEYFPINDFELNYTSDEDLIKIVEMYELKK